MKTGPVVVIGDANVDLVIRLPEHAAAPAARKHHQAQLFGGGSAANTAVGLARLYRTAPPPAADAPFTSGDMARPRPRQETGFDFAGAAPRGDRRLDASAAGQPAHPPFALDIDETAALPERRVHFCGAIGQDAYGDWVRQDLLAEGLELSALHALPGEFTTIVLAVIAPDGERSLNHFPPDGGAHNRLQVGDLPISTLRRCAWLHTTGISMRRDPEGDTVLEAMRLAKAGGARVSLDLNLRLEVFGHDAAGIAKFWQAVRLADVVFGSAHEEILPLTGASDVTKAAELLSEGRRVVVARLGAEGALWVTPAQRGHVPAFPAAVVDTLGAGDAFNSGFIYAALADSDLPDCVRWGNAVAAIKITRAGARGLPTLAEALAQLNA